MHEVAYWIKFWCFNKWLSFRLIKGKIRVNYIIFNWEDIIILERKQSGLCKLISDCLHDITYKIRGLEKIWVI